MGKAIYDDLIELVDEIERGSKDKTRTLNSVKNPTVKKILRCESDMALKAGITGSVLGSPTASAALSAIAGTGMVSAGLSTAIGGTVGVGLVGSGLTGAAAGSTVPIIGTVLGFTAGCFAGGYFYYRTSQKNAAKKELLHQKIMEKQNRCIRDLEIELNELKLKYGKAVEQNERYRYIIGILMANEELKKAA